MKKLSDNDVRLMDRLAGLAMSALVQCGMPGERIPAVAYGLAEAMLEERKKRFPDQEIKVSWPLGVEPDSAEWDEREAAKTQGE